MPPVQYGTVKQGFGESESEQISYELHVLLVYPLGDCSMRPDGALACGGSPGDVTAETNRPRRGSMLSITVHLWFVSFRVEWCLPFSSLIEKARNVLLSGCCRSCCPRLTIHPLTIRCACPWHSRPMLQNRGDNHIMCSC